MRGTVTCQDCGWTASVEMDEEWAVRDALRTVFNGYHNSAHAFQVSIERGDDRTHSVTNRRQA